MKARADVNDTLRQEGPEAVCKRHANARKFKSNSGQGPDTATPLFDPWDHYVVPAFPLDILPPVLRHFVDTQSVVLGADDRRSPWPRSAR